MTETRELSGQLVRITAPHFCAGLIVSDGRVVRTAPILAKSAMGLTSDQLRTLCADRGWRATIPQRSKDGELLDV